MNENKNARVDEGTSKRAGNLESEKDEALSLDYTTSVFPIASVLHIGRENALSPDYLKNLLGFKDRRSLRKEVERERRDGALICSSLESGGYFLPGSLDELRRYVRTQQARINTTKACLEAAEDLLREVSL